jgi:hypothetical protein
VGSMTSGKDGVGGERHQQLRDRETSTQNNETIYSNLNTGIVLL